MKRFVLAAAFLLVLAGGAPIPAYAQSNLPILNPSFEIVPNPNDHDASCKRGDPLSFGAVLQMIQNLMNASISVGAIVMFIIIVYAGVLFLMSPTNPGNREMGRTILMNSVIGFVIVLAAWLVVDFIMKGLYDPDQVIEGNTKLGPWNEIIGTGGEWCVKPINTKSLFDSDTPLGDGSDLMIGSDSPAGSGSCDVQTEGPCATSNFTAAFGPTLASQASQICSKESANGTMLTSGSDVLGDGTPYSFGLFQINITANPVAGLPCPNAFSKKNCLVSTCGKGTGVKVIDKPLYDKCKAAAFNTANNVAAAKQVYKDGGNTWRLWGTAKACKLAPGQS